MRTIALTPVLLLGACLDASETTSTADLSCVGMPDALAAPSTSMTGRVVSELGGTPISGATVVLLSPMLDAPLATAVTGVDGSYLAPLARTSGVSATYRKVSAEGYLDAYGFDSADAESPATDMMLTHDQAAQLYQDAGLTLDPAAGTLLVVVADCAGHTVRGATVTVAGAKRVVYLGDDTHFDLNAISTSGDSGVLLLGVPEGQVDVAIEVDGIAYRSQPIASHAGAVTTSWRRP